MNIDMELLERVAKTARLKLTEEEKKIFLEELNNIIDTFKIIDTCDTMKVSPSTQPIPLSDIMREDVIEESLSVEDALKNSTNNKDDYFKGPKVM